MSSESGKTKVKYAIAAVWGTLGICALGLMVDKLQGQISDAAFATGLLAYCLACIIPYKLQQGSNPARYVYLVLSVAGLLFWLSGADRTSTALDRLLNFLTLPVTVWTLIVLFSKAGSEKYVMSAGTTSATSPSDR